MLRWREVQSQSDPLWHGSGGGANCTDPDDVATDYFSGADLEEGSEALRAFPHDTLTLLALGGAVLAGLTWGRCAPHPNRTDPSHVCPFISSLPSNRYIF